MELSKDGGLTMVEHMALAVLRGDMAAAHALCDYLMNEPDLKMTDSQKWQEIRQQVPMDGMTLFRVPEFVALCRVLNIDLYQRIISMSINVPCDGIVTVDLNVQAAVDHNLYPTPISMTFTPGPEPAEGGDDGSESGEG